MKDNINIYILRILIILCMTAGFGSTALCSENSNGIFTLVIDAGHGGKDPGAVGRFSREKDINLAVAKAFGALVTANCKDVKVIYTRKTDTFVALNKRAEIANKANADLFVSIHTNALPGRVVARGCETYTLGMAKAQANLDVAKRENSVILIEKDYKTHYEGFDPNSSESYIIFEFMQDRHMERSVQMAKYIQKEFKNTAGRPDKGVHQAGFLVLRQTVMPSVLIELGYISTRDEEVYLNSKQGVDKLSRSIYNAFTDYLNRYKATAKAPRISDSPTAQKTKNTEQETGTTKETVMTVEAAAEEEKENSLYFKVQFLTSPRLLKEGNSTFKGVANVENYKEGNIYKYTYGNTGDYNEAKTLCKNIRKKFPDAFIVAFLNGEKITLSSGIDMWKKNK